jgi:hypothetical protein
MTSAIPAQDGRTDFDFLVGRWRVHHRILRGRLQQSTTWDEMEGTVVNEPILGGLGNMEEHSIERVDGPIAAIAVRVYESAAQEWSIYWADSVSPVLDAGVFGRFAGGRGSFYAQEISEGRHILTRFVWSDITPISAHWEQAYSADGGLSWEVNWIMEFSRIQEEGA